MSAVMIARLNFLNIAWYVYIQIFEVNVENLNANITQVLGREEKVQICPRTGAKHDMM